MKKKKLRHLSLKKTTISNLNGSKTNQTKNIVGATTVPCTISILFCEIVSRAFDCIDGTTDPNTQGCSMECTSHCNDTMTCRDWSCDCNQ